MLLNKIIINLTLQDAPLMLNLGVKTHQPLEFPSLSLDTFWASLGIRKISFHYLLFNYHSLKGIPSVLRLFKRFSRKFSDLDRKEPGKAQQVTAKNFPSNLILFV